jgi:general secretion pathway protein M
MKTPSILQTRWAALQPREKTLVLASAVLVLAALLWWLALAPALKTLRAAPQQHQALDAQLQQMKRLQAQATQMQSQPVLDQDASRRALDAAVKQRLGASTQVNVVGDRATVILKAVPADTIAPWLAQVRTNARALPVEVKLNRSSAPPATATGKGAAPATPPTAAQPLWDGTVVLALPSR